MTIDELIANGVISWVSAIIGGAFAVFGSYIAIRHENKKIREERMEQSRPFFDLIDYSDPRTIEANGYIFHFSKSDEYSSDKPKIAGNVVNSEKVEFIISKFTVNDNDYHPLFSEMVSKSMCFRVVVHLDCPLENEKVYMHVLDINHNERVYKTTFNNQRITGFEEIR